MDERKENNLKILKKLESYLNKYPDTRFIQALWSLHIVDGLDRMLDETGISQDINYFVNVTDKNNQPIGSIQPEILSDIPLTKRTITVFSKKSDNVVSSFISPAKITMTVKAPIWKEGGNPTFIDAQYKGYIVAELKYN